MLQLLSPGSLTINSKSGEYMSYLMLLDDSVSLDSFEIKINLEEGSEVVLNMATKQELGTRNISILLNHIGRNSRCKVTVHSLLDGSSKLFFDGMIKIAKDCSGVDSYLTHKSILLNDSAAVHTTPSLEIENNDVKASHSATAFTLKDTDFYYFQSRGISVEKAASMVKSAFFHSLAASLKIDEDKSRLHELLEGVGYEY